MPVLRVRAPLRPAGHGRLYGGTAGRAMPLRDVPQAQRHGRGGLACLPRRGVGHEATQIHPIEAFSGAGEQRDPPVRTIRLRGVAERVIGPDAVRVRYDGRCAHRYAGQVDGDDVRVAPARIAAQEHGHGLRGAGQRLRGIRTGQGRQAHRHRFTGCQHALAARYGHQPVAHQYHRGGRVVEQAGDKPRLIAAFGLIVDIPLGERQERQGLGQSQRREQRHIMPPPARGGPGPATHRPPGRGVRRR